MMREKIIESWTIEVDRGDLERLLADACGHLADFAYHSDGVRWGDSAEQLVGRITELVKALSGK